jgi:hypothetical protein
MAAPALPPGGRLPRAWRTPVLAHRGLAPAFIPGGRPPWNPHGPAAPAKPSRLAAPANPPRLAAPANPPRLAAPAKPSRLAAPAETLKPAPGFAGETIEPDLGQISQRAAAGLVGHGLGMINGSATWSGETGGTVPDGVVECGDEGRGGGGIGWVAVSGQVDPAPEVG